MALTAHTHAGEFGIAVSGTLRMAAALVLGVLLLALWRDFEARPTQERLARITVHLAPGGTRVLGRHELAAPAAEPRHIQLTRDSQGGWSLANVSAARAVELERSGQPDQRLHSLVLDGQQVLSVSGTPWNVLANRDTVTLQDVGGATVWRFDGATLAQHTSDGDVPTPACVDDRLGDRLRRAWNRGMPRAVQVNRPLKWGGSVACGLQLPSPEAPTGGLNVRRSALGFVVTADAAAARRVCLQPSTEGQCPAGASLFERQEPLANGDRITVGRSKFVVELPATDRSALHLIPVRRAGWLSPGDTPPPDMQWVRTTDDAWQWPWLGQPLLWVLCGWLLASLVAAMAWRRRLAGQQWPVLAWAVCSIAQWAALAAYVRGADLGLGWLLGLVSWAVLGTVLLPMRTGWAWVSHSLLTVMLLFGLMLQWQLGAQAVDTGGWIYFKKTASVGAAGLFSIQAFAWMLFSLGTRGTPRVAPGVASLEALLLLPGLVALLLLALQVLMGGEEGVFGFQPVELSKLALVLLAANALALRLEWIGPGGWRHWPRHWALWLRMLTPVLLFAALAALSLIWVRDYSPLLILSGWFIGLTAAWAVARRSLIGFTMVAGFLGLTFTVWWWLHGEGLAWMQAHGFYADRFAAWLDPHHHPHSGEQFLRALRFAARGEGMNAWQVPAVQDDMAPAFLIGRFGLTAAQTVLGIQLAYVGCLAMLGWQALQKAGPGDYRRRWALRLLFFTSWGAAALFAAHLVLSWGTNTGALPVMGQPMPLISAGASIIALLLIPLHLLWTVQPVLTQRPSAHGPGR